MGETSATMMNRSKSAHELILRAFDAESSDSLAEAASEA